MANFFRKIDKEQLLPEFNKEEFIYNLDKFHTICRNDNKIIAMGDATSPIIIAVCRTSAGAVYVMECIERGIDVSHHQLNLIEREK